MKKVIIPDGYPGQYTISKSGRDWTLAKGAELHDDGATGGIWESDAYSGNVFHINGIIENTLYPAGTAFASSGNGSRITIGKSAELTGLSTAISLAGDNQTLVNNGDLQGGVAGIYAKGENKTIANNGDIAAGTGIWVAGEATVSNDGTISAGVAGIRWTDGAGTLTLGRNSDIRSEEASMGNGVGIDRDNEAGVKSRTINDGDVMGSNYSFLGRDGNETLVNRGKMTGDVSLGAGDDTFDNRSGKLTGSVHGGAGSDTYLMGAKTFAIVEASDGTGTDTLKSTVTRVLDADWDIENLILLGKADINGFGDAGDNHITGNKGRNVLAGLAGADQLTGGAGRDTFLFKTGDDTDFIMDFENGVDRIDLSQWESVSSFADIKAKNYLFFVDGNTIISDGMGEELTLVDVKLAKLDKTDFIF
ncbi:calcium-binding protein [Rhizobium sp.]